MNLPDLQLGDLFVTHSLDSSFITKGILWISKLGSIDFDAYYSHAGIITYPNGMTFESGWPRIGSYNLYTEHTDKEIMIARHKLMTVERFLKGYGAICKYNWRLYPFWRFAAYITRTEKLIHWSSPVCGELVGMFLHYAIDPIACSEENRIAVKNTKTGKPSTDFSHWWGITPDNLADAFEKWTSDFDIIGVIS